MTVLHTLWLPILLSSAFAFLASFLLHMLLPWHRGDYAKLPDEDRVSDAFRSAAVPPGDYMAPFCDSPKEMKSTEFAAKMKRGPILVLTVIPSGPMRMGRSLLLWFLYLVVVSCFAAFVACHALPVGARYPAVFRIAGVTAFLGYTAALWQMSIWYHRSWRTTLKSTIDGLIYAGLTAGTFGWLWPR